MKDKVAARGDASNRQQPEGARAVFARHALHLALAARELAPDAASDPDLRAALELAEWAATTARLLAEPGYFDEGRVTRARAAARALAVIEVEDASPHGQRLFVERVLRERACLLGWVDEAPANEREARAATVVEGARARIARALRIAKKRIRPDEVMRALRVVKPGSVHTGKGARDGSASPNTGGRGRRVAEKYDDVLAAFFTSIGLPVDAASLARERRN